MVFQLRMATEDDVRGMCEVYFDAFGDSYIGRECFPPTSREAWDFWFKSNSEDLKNPRFHSLVITDASLPNDDNNNETIVAFAKWIAPEDPTENTKTEHDAQPLSQEQPVWPSDGNPALADAFFGAIAKTHEKLFNGVPHWYLELVATRKEFQGKGAAKSLISWGLEQADNDGMISYLDASPVAKAVYEKFGFEVLAAADFGTGKDLMTECFMARKGKCSEEQWRELCSRL